MSFQFIIDSVSKLFWRRKSTELKDFVLQRRTSDGIVTHDEKTQETSANLTANSQTKVTFSSVFENHYAQCEMNHVTLDVPYHMCNTGKQLNGDLLW